MVTRSPGFPFFRFSYSFHFSSLVTIQLKKSSYLFLPNSISHVENRRSSLSCLVLIEPISLLLNDVKLLFKSLLFLSANSSYARHEFSYTNAFDWATSDTFGLPLCSLSSTSNSPLVILWNHSRKLRLHVQIDVDFLQIIQANK